MAPTMTMPNVSRTWCFNKHINIGFIWFDKAPMFCFSLSTMQAWLLEANNQRKHELNKQNDHASHAEENARQKSRDYKTEATLRTVVCSMHHAASELMMVIQLNGVVRYCLFPVRSSFSACAKLLNTSENCCSFPFFSTYHLTSCRDGPTHKRKNLHTNRF